MFNTTFEQISTQIAQINQQITAHQEAIARLNEQKTNYENYLQQLSTAQQAAKSFIEQGITAISMLQAISPDLLPELRDTVENLFVPAPTEPKLIEAEKPATQEKNPTPTPSANPPKESNLVTEYDPAWFAEYNLPSEETEQTTETPTITVEVIPPTVTLTPQAPTQPLESLTAAQLKKLMKQYLPSDKAAKTKAQMLAALQNLAATSPTFNALTNPPQTA